MSRCCCCCCCRERVWGGGGGGCIAGTWELLLLLLALGGWRGAKTAAAAKRRTALDPAVRNVRWSVGSNAVGSTSAHLRDGRRCRCQCGSDSGFPEWMGSGMTGAGMESEQQQQ